MGHTHYQNDSHGENQKGTRRRDLKSKPEVCCNLSTLESWSRLFVSWNTQKEKKESRTKVIERQGSHPGDQRQCQWMSDASA